MGIFVGEHFIFYAGEQSLLESLHEFLKSNCTICEKVEFGNEINIKTEGGKELYGWNVGCGEIKNAKNPKDGLEFHLHTEQRNHSNFDALKELGEKYGVGICYEGGSAEAGGYQTYDPEGRYFIKNFEQMRFSNPVVCILFERIKNDDKLMEEHCKSVKMFFNDYKIDNKIFKINENAFYVELNQYRIGNPFVSPSLEEIKIGLRALSESLSLWMNYDGEQIFKSSLYFYISKGAAWFKDLEPGTSEWAQAEESFNYEGQYVDITNDKNFLFFRKTDFSSIINYDIVTAEDEEPVEKIQKIDRDQIQELKL